MDKTSYMVICKHRFKTSVNLSTPSDFFKNELIVKFLDDKIIFTIATALFNGKIFRFSKNKTNGFYYGTFYKDLPLGKYYFDEDESNEDRVVIYLDQNI